MSGIDSSLMAQRRGNQGREPGLGAMDDSLKEQGLMPCYRVPGLNKDQEAKIKKSKLNMEKERLPLENQKAEKAAHLKTLNADDNVDQGAIDRTIDEIALFDARIAKLENRHYQEVRSLLTDEQRVYFDSHARKRLGYGDGNGPRMQKQKKQLKRQPQRGPACRDM